MNEYSILVKGKKVYYKHSGKGDNIVLLHGIPTHSGLWDSMRPYLDGNYSVYAFDLLGFGESDRPCSEQINIKFQAEFFLEVFKELSLKEIMLVGHDIGGGIAQIMVVSNSKLFKCMVLIDSVCYDSWPIQLLSAGRNVEMLFKHLPIDVQYELFESYIKDGLFNKDKAKKVAAKYWRYIQDSEGINSFLKAVESFDNKYTLEISHMLGSIKLPALVLWGRNDAFIRMSYGYRLSEDLKNSDIHIIEDAGHFVPEDQPEKSSKIIDNFIKKIRI